ncbi:HTH_XRE domain containing protein [uncultured Caudovirales phage]|uniref:HTH_XRE domain containing protein n=1 Tax=uncultured Caudovirales phage TaxID=2100421 RepID=A0A6J5R303_9CAUD|nr:HTH_XRE domain containing protein [uncultured Caudovirales phage]
MQLIKFINETGLNRADFAEKCGLTRMGLYNILEKKCQPSMKTVQAIEAFSKGQVTYKDLAK